ncbi:MAG: hypothetical protein Kow00124_30240 [Anaerolineae bacterium]
MKQHRHIRLVVVVLTVVLLLALILAATVSAQTGVQATTLYNAKLRSGPGTGYPQIAVIPFGTVLLATGRNADSTWIQLNYNGIIGWTAASLLSLAGDVGSLPVGGIAVEAPAGGITGSNPNLLNVRAGPGTSYAALGQLPPGSTIVLNGRWGGGPYLWVRFDYNGREAWVAGWLLRISGDVMALPDIQAGESPPPSAPPSAPPPPAGAVIGTNTGVLNVRGGPGTSYGTLGQLPAGTTITLNARWGSGSSAWVRFDYNGQPAWVAAWLLRITGDVNSLPDIQAEYRAAEQAVRQICQTGQAVPLAAAYTGGPGVHPTLILNPNGTDHAWAGWAWSWRPSATLATQLVACVEPQQENVIEVCHYTGPDITRYQYSVAVRLFAVQSGQQIASTTLWGTPPRECRQWEPWDLVRLAGQPVQPNQLIDWLRPYAQP